MKRVTQLDGVRGIAILLVLVWHYFNCQLPADTGGILLYCSRATSLAWSGVDLFFVLSGFLIAGILLDHRDSANYFRIFYLRRVCRIFPLYFLLLGLFVCIMLTPLYTAPAYQWLFTKPLPVWSYASFTQNIFMGMRGEYGARWLGITWSLAVEEQFYLVVPLLIFFFRRRTLVCILAIAILAAPILRCATPGFLAFVNTPWRSDSLLSGALLAALVRWPVFIAAVRQHRRFLSALLLALLAGAAVMTVHPNPFGSFDHLWLAALYATFILFAFVSYDSPAARVLQSTVLVWFGRLSYGIYMFHQAVSGLVHGMVRHDAPRLHTLSDAGVTLAAFVLTLILAAVSFHFFESPLLRIGHRFQYLPKRDAGSPHQAPAQ